MKFIVIEGLDGSGKSTQIRNLQSHFEQRKIPCEYLHFPRTHTPVFGELIARFLRGEFGRIDQVDPYLVALLYAGDRDEAAGEIREWLEGKKLVLADRYVISNIAFQCAKISDPEKREELMRWIFHTEYGYFKIPRPDISLFLDVPSSFTESQLREERSGDERHYLRGKKDIHEDSLDFQNKVRSVYLHVADHTDQLHVIDCSDGQGNILSPDDVFKKILDAIHSHLKIFQQ